MANDWLGGHFQPFPVCGDETRRPSEWQNGGHSVRFLFFFFFKPVYLHLFFKCYPSRQPLYHTHSVRLKQNVILQKKRGCIAISATSLRCCLSSKESKDWTGSKPANLIFAPLCGPAGGSIYHHRHLFLSVLCCSVLCL